MRGHEADGGSFGSPHHQIVEPFTVAGLGLELQNFGVELPKLIDLVGQEVDVLGLDAKGTRKSPFFGFFSIAFK